jgi:hypothetical protein
LLSIDAQLIKANASKNVSFFFILSSDWKSLRRIDRHSGRARHAGARNPLPLPMQLRQ